MNTVELKSGHIRLKAFCAAHGTTEGVPDDTECCQCHSADDEESMLICDGCENGYHMGCLSPPLRSVPAGDWFCRSCTSRRVDDGVMLQIREKKRGGGGETDGSGEGSDDSVDESSGDEYVQLEEDSDKKKTNKHKNRAERSGGGKSRSGRRLHTAAERGSSAASRPQKRKRGPRAEAVPGYRTRLVDLTSGGAVTALAPPAMMVSDSEGEWSDGGGVEVVEMEMEGGVEMGEGTASAAGTVPKDNDSRPTGQYFASQRSKRHTSNAVLDSLKMPSDAVRGLLIYCHYNESGRHAVWKWANDW